MWPVLLDMTRDDCRRTLRRLELEAYSSLISVFRAQGALEDNRKKMLEDLRGALHISFDRHNAEARRVANDELLATIAEQLSGPNTGLGWISEGRRRIPLMPRGIPQSVYTEIADQAAIEAVEDNKNINFEHTNEETVDMLELPDDIVEMKIERQTFPIVMEDQSFKLLESGTPARKKFKLENDGLTEAPTLPSTMRVSNQKHVNISQIYSTLSKTTPTGKMASQQKHLYNQGSKSSNKANQGHTTKAPKHRSHKQSSNSNKVLAVSAKHQARDSITFSGSMSPIINQGRTPTLAADSGLKGNISGFQATFTQSLKKQKSHKEHFSPDLKLSTPVHDSHTMQILSPGSVMLDDPNNTRLSESLDTHQFQAQEVSQFHTPTTQNINKTQHSLSSKSCHFIIKKKNEPISDGPMSPQKIQVAGIQMIQKPAEVGGVKVLQNCQVFVTPSSTGQKLVNTAGKIIASQATSKLQPQTLTNVSPSVAHNNLNLHSFSDSKVIIVSNAQTATSPASTMQISNIKSKNIIVSANTTINKDLSDVTSEMNADTENIANKAITIDTNDLKMPTKTLFLNSKGHKMVVLPKSRAKTSLIHSMPVLQVKGIQGRPTMKLVPVNSQIGGATIKSAGNISIVSKPVTITAANTTASNKILTVEATSTTKLNTEIPEIKVMQNPQTISKLSNQAIVKPPGSKSNVIVVQKGIALNKGSITFTRNGNDMPKIVMSSKVVNPVSIQSSSLIKTVTAGPKMAISVPDASKNSSNIIVLELSNEQMARAASIPDAVVNEATSTTIIPEEGQIAKQESVITVDTPVLFDSQITEDTCNTNSVDSMTDSIMDMVQIDTESEHTKHIKKESEVFGVQNTMSNNNDWEMELDTVDVKQKRVSDLSMDMGISSDSETDAYLVKEKAPVSKPQQISNPPTREPAAQAHSFAQHDILNRAGRTLLSQLQDDGSSSNDSPFISSKNIVKQPSRLHDNTDTTHKLKIDLRNDEKVSSAQPIVTKKEDISSCEREASSEKNQPRPRIDIFSTAIASADINLDSFEYLEESIMSTDEMFQLGKTTSHGQTETVDSTTVVSDKGNPALELQLSDLLAEDNVNTTGDKSIDSNYT